MKRTKVKGLDGKEIIRLTPETDDELKELQDRAIKGKVHDDGSFSDDPQASVDLANDVEVLRARRGKR